MLTQSLRVLVVDDDRGVAESHASLLRELSYEPVVQVDPLGVEQMLVQDGAIELVLLDIRMPTLCGLELLRRVKLRRPHVGVVMATVVNDIEHAVTAIKSGAYNYLLKPLAAERLKAVVESWMSNRPARLVDDPRFAALVTASRRMEPVFHAIRVFAEADVTTLIEGETGTGKELVAELLHSLSRRAGSRFIALNVAAISPSLFEAELFGHRRGAFTGASGDHPGFFDAAADGTLFLDEIGELGDEQQTKLLRVLQSRRYCRVGETIERDLRARVVLATNRDLRAEVQDGRFRADLFYRLSGHTVHLPALRDREGDVKVLSEYFRHKYNSQFGRAVEGFEPEAQLALERYPFPGNVRELESLVSGAVLLEQSARVRPGTLPPHVRLADTSGGEDMDAVKLRAIREALNSCNGNQTRAAQKLGLSRGHLNRLLKQYRDKGLGVDAAGKTPA
jgi:DNA-binding NtrC family response regulator